MPVYVYKADDSLGRRISGSLACDTKSAARETLRRKGLSACEVHEARFDAGRRLKWPHNKARRRELVCEFARQLALLLRNGVSLVEALDVLIRQFGGAFRTILQDVRDRVSAGIPFHESLEMHPTWFDVMYRSAVRVGQHSGRLEYALKDLAEYENQRATMRARLLTALAYPSILAVVGLGVVLFLMSYVVPQLLTVLQDAGRPLPAPTRMLKTFSDFITGHWIALCAGGTGATLGFLALCRSPRGLRTLQSLQLHVPWVGDLLRKTLVAQFAQKMSLLLQNGVPFLEALRLIRCHAHHLVLADELAEVESAIQRGSDIAPTLMNSRIFPPLVVHVVNVGQKAGELPDMLKELRDGYETEVRLALGKFAAALEPMLIVVMSAVVGFVVFAAMLPILETTRAIR